MNMTIQEAIAHAREAAERNDLCKECREEHAQLANWLQELADIKKGVIMNYNIIEVTLKNRHTATWEANKGEWDDYEYDGRMLIIKKAGEWVGIYNMDHVICVVVK